MAVRSTDGGQHPQEKDKLISLISVVRYRASDGRQALEKGGRGDKNLGIEKENELRGSGQQMNLHLCSEANRVGRKNNKPNNH